MLNTTCQIGQCAQAMASKLLLASGWSFVMAMGLDGMTTGNIATLMIAFTTMAVAIIKALSDFRQKIEKKIDTHADAQASQMNSQTSTLETVEKNTNGQMTQMRAEIVRLNAVVHAKDEVIGTLRSMHEERHHRKDDVS